MQLLSQFILKYNKKVVFRGADAYSVGLFKFFLYVPMKRNNNSNIVSFI